MIRTQINIEDAWPWAKNFPSLAALISSFLPLALLLGGIIFFGLIVFAGFSIITGAGSSDAQAQEKWKQILTKGVIGLIIIFAAYWVLQIINFITKGSLKDILGS